MFARSLQILAGVATVGALSLFSSSAQADDTNAASPPPLPPGYRVVPTEPGYTAPLSQTTQSSYVPQSVALSGPREIKDYQEGDPVPPGYQPVERVRKGLIIGGAVTFGTLYLISAFIASAGADLSGRDSNPAAAMWVPGVGPFVQIANTDSATANVFLAVDGIAQCAGIVMLAVGITSPKTVLLRNDLATGVKVQALPILAKDMSGAALVGTF